MTGPAVGVIANPVSGRDIRRVAARGTVATTQDKRSRIARAVVGAVTAGVTRIVVMDEPFGLATAALADLGLGRHVEVDVVDVGARLDAEDTRRAALAMRDRGVAALVVLGGDGTSRAVARVWPEVPLVALSTGTNNVFPTMTEATVAGAAAGLVATGRVPSARVAAPAKVVRLRLERHGDDDGSRAGSAAGEDLALVDAVFLVGDMVGNRMPFDPDLLRLLVLSRAEPTAIGVSSIGGLTVPSGAADDFGVVVHCGPGGRLVHAPLAPGSYRQVPVREARPLVAGETVVAAGPAVLALDGDRLYRLEEGDTAELRVVRDGPRVIDVVRVMGLAAQLGLFVDDHVPDTGLLVSDPITTRA